MKNSVDLTSPDRDASPLKAPRPKYQQWILALGFVPLWYAILRLVSLSLFEVWPASEALQRDLSAHLILGLTLFFLARNLRWYLITIAVLMTTLHLSNAGKIAVLGGPIMPDDFLAMWNLFKLLDGWQWLGAALILALPLTLTVLMIDWRAPRTWVMLMALGGAGTALAIKPTATTLTMDRYFGNVVWNQRGNFEQRGLLLHLLQEGSRYLSRGTQAPDATEVAQALQYLRKPPSASALSHPAVVAENPLQRNVHMILLESFWDPTVLSAAQISEDPLDPEFRTLWQATGRSQILSPVFGGYTANAEFEVLCGFPVSEDAVFFEGWLRRDVPCLPRHLVQDGYSSVASHPNDAAFWNRVNAYQRIGFTTYLADTDFDLDDMNDVFLSDASLYRQVMEKIEPMLDAGQPVFNYVLTYFGHLPYPLNEQRPRVIETSDPNSMTDAYVNTVYYKSRELMVFLRELQQRDPQALIVMLGDHLPFLGPNFAGFTDSDLLADNRSKFDAQMFHTLVATPLIVIDGERGPQQLGDVPLYQLPNLILNLLGDTRESLLRLTATSASGPRIRPLPGMYHLADDIGMKVCKHAPDDDPQCAQNDAWVHAVEVLTRDVFGGEQHALKHVEKPAHPDGSSQAIASKHPPQ